MACGGGDPQAPAATPPAPAVEMVWADGWDKVELLANYAHTVIDSGAHFTTDRNACGFPGYGVLDMNLWNQLATDLNAFIKAAKLTDERCTDVPDGYGVTFKFDGTADVDLLAGTKMMLFENRNWTVCSLIQDQALHQRLMDEINQVVLMADKEDCQRPGT
jgi:hypothetical protein